MTAPSGVTVSPAPADRAALGRRARGRAPRSGHGEFEAAPDRPDASVSVRHRGGRRVSATRGPGGRQRFGSP
ncbi:hypothetical protein [Streptomyces sp. NPDC048191]|uniref:hypothetical protein n=1 Tax=Streptomyces sp. NPDC048191 TaxID=3155484 RepID=UPI00340F5F72